MKLYPSALDRRTKNPFVFSTFGPHSYYSISRFSDQRCSPLGDQPIPRIEVQLAQSTLWCSHISRAWVNQMSTYSGRDHRLDKVFRHLSSALFGFCFTTQWRAPANRYLVCRWMDLSLTACQFSSKYSVQALPELSQMIFIVRMLTPRASTLGSPSSF
jgi:hypothetical protein